MATFDKRVVRTKRDLKEAFLTLLETHTYDFITVKQIIAVARYNRGTFYTHYRNKDELLHELIADHFSLLETSYKKLVIHRFSTAPFNFSLLFQHFYECRRFYETMLQQPEELRFRQQLEQKIASLIVSDYILQKKLIPSLNMELFALYTTSGFMSLLLHWIEQRYTYTPAYMSEQFSTILHISMPTYPAVRQSLTRQKSSVEKA